MNNAGSVAVGRAEARQLVAPDYSVLDGLDRTYRGIQGGGGAVGQRKPGSA